MNKYFVLLNVDNNKYWTGRVWDNPFSVDIKEAKFYNSEDEILKDLSYGNGNEDAVIREHVDTPWMFEVRTVYASE